MRSARFTSALVISALWVGAAAPAAAQLAGHSPWQESERTWLSMDKCKRQAWQQFPDYTRESNAKRDRAVQQCLARANLPPLPPLSPHDVQDSPSR